MNIFDIKIEHFDIIITQSPRFTLGFNFDALYSMGFDRCIMIHIHANTIQSIFSALKIFLGLSITLSPVPHSGKPLMFLLSP